jgi:hypothetical protein
MKEKNYKKGEKDDTKPCTLQGRNLEYLYSLIYLSSWID